MKKLVPLLFLVIVLMCGCLYSSGDFLPDNTMNVDEIAAMEDAELYDALVMRFMDAAPDALNEKQRTVAALITFDAEMMNGGLCQFFVNDYHGYAQYIGDALEEVGAMELQAHYSDFVAGTKSM